MSSHDADLRISADLDPLPLDALTSTFGILAIRGAGKTYTASVLAEEMLGAALRIVVHDPTGAWWGLRSSADGKSPGLPIIIFGGEHADVPLDEHAGRAIADLIVDGSFSCVLDTSLFESKASVIRFMLALTARLYHRNREPLHVFLDEADQIAPQKCDGEHAKLLAAVETLVRLGRRRGLGVTLITQRAAVLNKDVLSQVETLVALRTTSPHDRKAIDDWVRGHATEEDRARVLGSLAKLKNGQAWFCSPAFLGVLELVTIRARRTFDSGATPKVGERRREPKALTPVDVEAIRAALAEVVERAESEDPDAMRRRIEELEGKLKRLPPVQVERVEVPVPVITPEMQEAFAKACAELKATGDAIVAAFARVDISRIATPLHREDLARKLTQGPGRAFTARAEKGVDLRNVNLGAVANGAPAPAGVRVTAERSKTTNGSEPEPLFKGAREMLRALASMRRPLTRVQLATLVGMSPKSSTFRTYLGRLRGDGLVVNEGASELAITEAGLAMAGEVARPATTLELRELWGSKLFAGARTMLDLLIDEYPNGLSKDELAHRAGMSPSSSTFRTYVGKLAGNGLAERRNGQVFAASTFFVGDRS